MLNRLMLIFCHIFALAPQMGPNSTRGILGYAAKYLNLARATIQRAPAENNCRAPVSLSFWLGQIKPYGIIPTRLGGRHI